MAMVVATRPAAAFEISVHSGRSVAQVVDISCVCGFYNQTAWGIKQPMGATQEQLNVKDLVICQDLIWLGFHRPPAPPLNRAFKLLGPMQRCNRPETHGAFALS